MNMTLQIGWLKNLLRYKELNRQEDRGIAQEYNRWIEFFFFNYFDIIPPQAKGIAAQTARVLTLEDEVPDNFNPTQLWLLQAKISEKAP
jgi:hypothetical protein